MGSDDDASNAPAADGGGDDDDIPDWAAPDARDDASSESSHGDDWRRRSPSPAKKPQTGTKGKGKGQKASSEPPWRQHVRAPGLPAAARRPLSAASRRPLMLPAARPHFPMAQMHRPLGSAPFLRGGSRNLVPAHAAFARGPPFPWMMPGRGMSMQAPGAPRFGTFGPPVGPWNRGVRPLGRPFMLRQPPGRMPPRMPLKGFKTLSHSRAIGGARQPLSAPLRGSRRPTGTISAESLRSPAVKDALARVQAKIASGKLTAPGKGAGKGTLQPNQLQTLRTPAPRVTTIGRGKLWRGAAKRSSIGAQPRAVGAHPAGRVGALAIENKAYTSVKDLRPGLGKREEQKRLTDGGSNSTTQRPALRNPLNPWYKGPRDPLKAIEGRGEKRSSPGLDKTLPKASQRGPDGAGRSPKGRKATPKGSLGHRKRRDRSQGGIRTIIYKDVDRRDDDRRDTDRRDDHRRDTNRRDDDRRSVKRVRYNQDEHEHPLHNDAHADHPGSTRHAEHDGHRGSSDSAKNERDSERCERSEKTRHADRSDHADRTERSRRDERYHSPDRSERTRLVEQAVHRERVKAAEFKERSRHVEGGRAGQSYGRSHHDSPARDSQEQSDHRRSERGKEHHTSFEHAEDCDREKRRSRSYGHRDRDRELPEKKVSDWDTWAAAGDFISKQISEPTERPQARRDDLSSTGKKSKAPQGVGSMHGFSDSEESFFSPSASPGPPLRSHSPGPPLRSDRGAARSSRDTASAVGSSAGAREYTERSSRSAVSRPAAARDHREEFSPEYAERSSRSAMNRRAPAREQREVSPEYAERSSRSAMSRPASARAQREVSLRSAAKVAEDERPESARGHTKHRHSVDSDDPGGSPRKLNWRSARSRSRSRLQKLLGSCRSRRRETYISD